MERPFNPEQLYKYIDDKMTECIYHSDFYLTPGVLGAVIGHMEEAIKQNIVGATKNEISEMRRKILGFLFGSQPTSSKDLVTEEVYALKEWIDAQDFDGKWLPQIHFSDEIKFLIWRLL